jgi:hypothetical protein
MPSSPVDLNRHSRSLDLAHLAFHLRSHQDSILIWYVLYSSFHSWPQGRSRISNMLSFALSFSREMESAVVSAAEGAIHTLLGKLGAVLVQETQLLGGVHDEMQYLKDELESMTAFLQDLAERNESRKQVKIWMKQIREIAYDVEDCIDEFRHQLEGSSNSSDRSLAFIHRTTHILRTIRVWHRLGKQIQKLKMRAANASDRNSR